MYSDSREQRVGEETSSRLLSRKLDGGSRLKIGADENRGHEPARCETNREEVESKERCENPYRRSRLRSRVVTVQLLDARRVGGRPQTLNNRRGGMASGAKTCSDQNDG